MSAEELREEPFMRKVSNSPQETIDRLKRIPQSAVLHFIYQHTHDESGCAAGISIDQQVEYLRMIIGGLHFRDNGDDDIKRIVYEKKTTTDEEQELLLIWNLRSGLTFLAWQWLEQSTIPDEIKSKFSTKKEHLWGDDYMEAIESLADWAQDQPQEDAPFEFTPEIETSIRNIHERGAALINFYNLKKPYNKEVAGLVTEGNLTMDLVSGHAFVMDNLLHFLGSSLVEIQKEGGNPDNVGFDLDHYVPGISRGYRETDTSEVQ